MFTRQKKNYRIFIYAALIITLCILVVALMWPKTAEPDAVDQANAQTDAEDENSIDADNKDREMKRMNRMSRQKMKILMINL